MRTPMHINIASNIRLAQNGIQEFFLAPKDRAPLTINRWHLSTNLDMNNFFVGIQIHNAAWSLSPDAAHNSYNSKSEWQQLDIFLKRNQAP